MKTAMAYVMLVFANVSVAQTATVNTDSVRLTLNKIKISLIPTFNISSGGITKLKNIMNFRNIGLKNRNGDAITEYQITEYRLIERLKKRKDVPDF